MRIKTSILCLIFGLDLACLVGIITGFYTKSVIYTVVVVLPVIVATLVYVFSPSFVGIYRGSRTVISSIDKALSEIPETKASKEERLELIRYRNSLKCYWWIKPLRNIKNCFW